MRSITPGSTVRRAAALLLAVVFGLAGSPGALLVSGPRASSCACCKAEDTSCAQSCCAPRHSENQQPTPTQSPPRTGTEWSLPVSTTTTLYALPGSASHRFSFLSDFPQVRAVPIFQRDCSYLI